MSRGGVGVGGCGAPPALRRDGRTVGGVRVVSMATTPPAPPPGQPTEAAAATAAAAASAASAAVAAAVAAAAAAGGGDDGGAAAVSRADVEAYCDAVTSGSALYVHRGGWRRG